MKKFINSSIGFKLKLGFLIGVIFLIINSLISFRAINKSIERFNEFSKVAKQVELTGQIQEDILMLRMLSKNYIISSNQSDKELFDIHFSKTIKYLNKQIEKDEFNIASKVLTKISKNINNYSKYLNEVKKNTDIRNQDLNLKLNKIGPSVKVKLNDVLTTQTNAGNYKIAFLMTQALNSLMSGRIEVIKFLDTKSESNSSLALKHFSEMQITIQKLESILRKDSKLLKTSSSILREINTYVKSFENLMKAVEKKKSIITQKLDVQGPIFAREIANLKDLNLKKQNNLKEKMIKQNKKTKKIIIFSFLISIIATILIASFFSSYITKVITGIETKLKTSALAVKEMGESLLKQSKILDEDTKSQQENLNETSSATNEISGVIQNNSKTTEDTSKIAQESLEKTKKGQNSILEIKNSINQIQNNSDGLSQNLDESNKEIGSIVDIFKEIVEKTQVINDIVFQTKLLSFNASVEASRAGEHGKGFAVVAQEIGNLASMSGEASNEISELLDASTTKVESIVSQSNSRTKNLVKETKITVNHGLNTTNKCEVIFDSIVDSFQEVNRSINNISIGSNEQTAGIEEINKSISEVSLLNKNNLNLVQGMSKNAKDLKIKADELNSYVISMNRFIHGNKN